MAIKMHGINALPALMIEGELVLQGIVPSVTEIARLMKNKDLLHSKLFQLHTLSVAVDMSEASANALAFGWKIAHKLFAEHSQYDFSCNAAQFYLTNLIL